MLARRRPLSIRLRDHHLHFSYRLPCQLHRNVHVPPEPVRRNSEAYSAILAKPARYACANAPYETTTSISPTRFLVGFTVIRTSCPSAVKNSISRPTLELPARLRISAETCGCLMPSTCPARAVSGRGQSKCLICP